MKVKSLKNKKIQWLQEEQEPPDNSLMIEDLQGEQDKPVQVVELQRAVTSEECRIFLEKIAKREQTRNIPVWFSMGKDSLCVYQKLKDWGFNPVLFWYCIFPDLQFQNKTLEYYEKLFDTKIHRLLGPSIYKFHWAGTYMPFDYMPLLDKLNCPNIDFTDLQNFVIEDYAKEMNLMSYNAVGLRASDSFNRRKVFEKFGYFNHNLKKVYPVIEYKIEDIKKELLKNNIPLPVDYKIWGRTYDGMHYYFLRGLKDNFPEDYQKVLYYCPLAEMELLRIEHHFKDTIKTFMPRNLNRWTEFKIIHE